MTPWGGGGHGEEETGKETERQRLGSTAAPDTRVKKPSARGGTAPGTPADATSAKFSLNS